MDMTVRAPIMDMSMRGPLNLDESPIFEQWLVEWNELKRRVPQCSLPEAIFGQWRIERYQITDQDSYHLFRKDMRNGGQRKVWIAPGVYTRLVTDQPTVWGWPGGAIMYDTFVELDFIDRCLTGASGDVLECGLGLGLFITAALSNSAINSITVLEIEPLIVKEIGKYFSDSRLKIIEADFRTWKPEKTSYSRIWLDTIDEHNEPLAVARLEAIGDVRLYSPKLLT